MNQSNLTDAPSLASFEVAEPKPNARESDRGGGSPPQPGPRAAVLNTVLLLLWAIGSLYVGAGAFSTVVAQRDMNEHLRTYQGREPTGEGVTIDGVTFKSIEDYIIWSKQEQAGSLFPWAAPLPEYANLALVTAAFAGVGAVIACVRDATKGARAGALPAISGPMAGALTGIVLFAVLAAGGVLMSGSTKFDFHPLSLALVGLVGGIFADEVYEATVTRLKRLVEI